MENDQFIVHIFADFKFDAFWMIIAPLLSRYATTTFSTHLLPFVPEPACNGIEKIRTDKYLTQTMCRKRGRWAEQNCQTDLPVHCRRGI
jgi:hypothetical protein